MTKRSAAASGATHPGFLDVLTAAILLAILLYASWRQFPAFDKSVISSPAAPPPASAPVQGANH